MPDLCRIIQANWIPIVIVAPGVAKPGTSSRALIETVDIFPTVAELAGLCQPTGPQPIDGRSMVPVLRAPDTSVKDHAYHAFPKGSRSGQRLGRAIRTERYRMVEWKRFGASAEEAQYELYDYRNDPLETVNLASERPEVMAKMIAILDGHPEARAPSR